MRVAIRATIAIVLIGLPMFYAYAARRKAQERVQGQVIEIQTHRMQSPEFTSGGSNPSDAPLTSRYYAFEVSIRVGCKTYVGIYQTPFNYLPSEFKPDQRVDFVLTKHVMYFDVPYTAGIRMRIVRRKNECGTR